MAGRRAIHYVVRVFMSTCFQRYWPRVSIVGAMIGCAPAQSAAPPEVASAPTSALEPRRLDLIAMPLKPLTVAEQALESQLRADIAEVLSAGERHTGNDWGLAVATDNLAARLEGLELAVEREGFVGLDGALGQNLVVNLRGSHPTPDVVMVGARFDSVPGSAGADDNATGVAALLAMARALQGRPRQNTLQLVWFSDASSRQVPENMGAWQHLEHLGKRRLDEPAEEQVPPSPFRVCVEVHGLGVYSEAPDSQGVAAGMPAGHPIGEFVEVASLAQDSVLGEQLAVAMGRASNIPIKGVTWLDPETTQTMTAFRAYSEHRCPAVLVSDTQKRRFAGFGTQDDTVEQIDFARLARAVSALIAGVDTLLNAAPVETKPSAAKAPAGDDRSPLGEAAPVGEVAAPAR